MAIAPTTSLSLSKGTATKLRAFASLMVAFRILSLYVDADLMSVMWINCFVRTITPRPLLGSGKITGSRSKNSRYLGGAPCVAVMRKLSPSRSQRLPNLASQMRVALANMVLKTGSNALGALEMMRSTSEVAVCCSNASCSSRVSRATSASWLPAKERREATFGASRGFSFTALRRRDLAGPLAALARLFIASSVGAGQGIVAGQTSTRASSGTGR